MNEPKYTIDGLCRAVQIIIEEVFPAHERFDIYPYSLQDLVNQIVFELIKEEYKASATKNTIQYYINHFDIEADNRKYTRAIQYSQVYRNDSNDLLEDNVGMRLPDLEAPDMTGANRFLGHSYNLCEYLQIKMQAECKLLNKSHEGQIHSSKKVSEAEFQRLFEHYASQIDSLEPVITEINPNNIISRIMAYYALETHFLFDFIYNVTCVAERHGFPKEIPVDPLISICSYSLWIPAAEWCPGSIISDLCIMNKWDLMAEKVYSSDKTALGQVSDFILDCKRIKGRLLSPERLERFQRVLSQCSFEDKITFLKNHFWFWDNRPQYVWNEKRIRYYRKLDYALKRAFDKPHIK